MISWDEIRQEGCMDSMPVNNEYIKQFHEGLVHEEYFPKAPITELSFQITTNVFYIPALSLGV